MVASALKWLHFDHDRSNHCALNVLKQETILKAALEDCEKNPKAIEEQMGKLRDTLTNAKV